MSTHPHPILDVPTSPLDVGDDSLSKTSAFMGPRLREMEEAKGRPATDGDRLQVYREWDDYKDRRFIKRVAIAAGAITTIGGAIFAVWVNFKTPETKPADVLEKVEDEAAEERKGNRSRAELNGRNNETMAGMIVEQQELTVKAVDHISKKIDAAHPRQADALGKVKKPPELKAAEEAVEKRKRDAAVGALLEHLPDPDEK